MEAVSVRTARLADQASRCGRFAENPSNEAMRQKLLALADEYETRVRL
jgi:hypothetical protein